MRMRVVWIAAIAVAVAGTVAVLRCGGGWTPPAGVSAMFVRTPESRGAYGDYFACGQIVSFSVDGGRHAFWVTADGVAEAFEEKRGAMGSVQFTLPCAAKDGLVRRIGAAPGLVRWAFRAGGIAAVDVTALISAAGANGAEFSSLDLDRFAALAEGQKDARRYAVVVDASGCANGSGGDALAWKVPFVREYELGRAADGAPVYARTSGGRGEYFVGVRATGGDGVASSRDVVAAMSALREGIASERVRKAVDEAVRKATGDMQKKLDAMQKSLDDKGEFISAFDIWGNYAGAPGPGRIYPTSGYAFKLTGLDDRVSEEDFTVPAATMSTTVREAPSEKERALLSVFRVRHGERLKMDDFGKRGFKAGDVEMDTMFGWRGTVGCTRDDALLGFSEFAFGVEKDRREDDVGEAAVTCCDVCGMRYFETREEMAGFLRGLVGKLTVDYGMRVTPAKNSNADARVTVLDTRRVCVIVRDATYASAGGERNIVMVLVRDKDFRHTGFPEETNDLHR